MSISRLPESLRNAGIPMALLGVIALLAPVMVRTLDGSPSQREGAACCSSIGIVFLLVGVPMLVARYSFYKIGSGQVLVDNHGKIETEGWYFGLPLASPTVISTAPVILEIPDNNKVLELDTPDGGLLGAAVSLSYGPDLKNPHGLRNFQNKSAINKALIHRVMGALHAWTMQKPFPGTLKRALSMQKEAERYLFAKLIGAESESKIPPEFGQGTPIRDLGIRIYEINALAWRPLEIGSGKPDWGDGDHIAFDAQVIFKQFQAHTDNLSELLKLKEALKDSYPEEIWEAIDDIYNSFSIDMKEHKDR